MSESLGCARCGDCCDPVIMTWDPADDLLLWTTEMLANVPDPRTDEGWAKWLSWTGGKWTEADRERAIASYDPDGTRRHNADFIAEHWQVIEHNRREARHPVLKLRCAAFDPVHRLCTAHENRPPICSGFPHYGSPPRDDDYGLGPRLSSCSFWRDFPPEIRPEGTRPLIPLEVTR